MTRMTTGAALTACIFLALAPHAGAAEMKINGMMNLSVAQQQAMPLGSPDHLAVLSLDKGTSASPGSPLDGATLMLAETVIIDKGNGPESGTITFGNDKGSITSEIRGTVKTVMVDGQPHISNSGTYKMIAGTGIFTGGTGHGTYKGAFSSKTDWAGKYSGILVLPKREAAR